MNRPTGVTILAILYFIGTCFLALLGVGSLVGMSFLGQMSSQHPEVGSGGAAFLAGAGVLLAVLFFGLAVVCAFLGYGMLTLKNWARVLAFVFAIIGAVFGAMGLVWAILHFSAVGIVMSGGRLGINVLIAWYLNQPHVKASFGMSDVQPPAMGGATGMPR